MSVTAACEGRRSGEFESLAPQADRSSMRLPVEYWYFVEASCLPFGPARTGAWDSTTVALLEIRNENLVLPPFLTWSS